METPWGHLKDIDFSDLELCQTILAEDKHQLSEGLVVESIFDQIIDAVPDFRRGAVLLDIESAVVDTRRSPDRWHIFVWARSRGPGLGRYLSALERQSRPWLVELEHSTGTFLTREWKDGATIGAWRPLESVMSELAKGRRPKLAVAKDVRDGERQKLAFWGFLLGYYGDQLGARVVLPRLFLNHGIQPWFRAVWNIDRILVDGDDIWALEIKHKFPFGRSGLRFGINDGELNWIRLVGEAGIRCFHAILAKPSWTKDSGSGYLLNRIALKERAALIGVELDRPRVRAMFEGKQGTSPEYTTFSGSGSLSYRSLPASDFVQIGMMSDIRSDLASNMSLALAGHPLPGVTDRWLRNLRIE